MIQNTFIVEAVHRTVGLIKKNISCNNYFFIANRTCKVYNIKLFLISTGILNYFTAFTVYRSYHTISLNKWEDN
jgi:hypothetical protein